MPSIFFKAPSNFEDLCSECGHKIQPQEMAVEVGEYQYLHMVCFDWRVEDFREQQASA